MYMYNENSKQHFLTTEMFIYLNGFKRMSVSIGKNIYGIQETCDKRIGSSDGRYMRGEEAA